MVPDIPNLIWKPTVNFHSRAGRVPVAVVHHITDDLNVNNVLSWFQNANSKASAHFVVSREIQDNEAIVYQMVSTAQSAWTNGDINQPRKDIIWLDEAVKNCLRGGANLNDYCITIEYVGKPDVPPTLAQYRAGNAIMRWSHCAWGIPYDRGHQLRHSDINSVTRSYCPGPSFDLGSLIRAVGGDPKKMNP